MTKGIRVSDSVQKLLDLLNEINDEGPEILSGEISIGLPYDSNCNTHVGKLNSCNGNWFFL